MRERERERVNDGQTHTYVWSEREERERSRSIFHRMIFPNISYVHSTTKYEAHKYEVTL